MRRTFLCAILLVPVTASADVAFAAESLPEAEDLRDHTLSALMAKWGKEPDPAVAGEILYRLEDSRVHGGPPSIAKHAKEYELPPGVVQVLVDDFQSFVKFPPARKPDCVKSWRIGDFVYVEGFTMEERGLIVRGGPGGVAKSEVWRNEVGRDYLLLVGKNDEEPFIVAKGRADNLGEMP